MVTRAVAVPAIHPGAVRGGIALPADLVRRVVGPLSGLLLLVSAVALPAAISLNGIRDVAVPARATAPANLTRLDAFGALPESAWPRSPSPVAGLAFVRCTRLWTMLPDGSGAHRILSMEGAASPTFSPDARTIAFLAPRPEGSQVWMAAADGSKTLLVGTLESDGRPVTAPVGGLTWSRDGTLLAFAVGALARERESWSIWTLDVAAGSFQLLGSGGPTPFWLDRGSLAVAGPGPDADFRLLAGKDRWTAKRLSSSNADLSASMAPGWWTTGWSNDTAVLRRDEGGNLELALRRRAIATPPDGWTISPSARPAVLEGGPVAVTLIDVEGGKDLGLVDPATGTWTLMDYAWDPAWSPAPPALGSLESAQAASLVRELLWRWSGSEPDQVALALSGPTDPSLLPFKRLGFTFGEAARRGPAWVVPATVFGRTGDGFGFRRVSFSVRPESGRLTVAPTSIGSIRPIRTIAQATRLLDSILSARVVRAAGLPAGTVLARDAIYAWSWGGRTTGSLNLKAPAPSGGGKRSLTINFGASGFGCGPSPVPLELATGTPAIANDPAEGTTYNQVAWPAGPRESSGPFGVSAELPRETVIAIAAAMDARRLAARG